MTFPLTVSHIIYLLATKTCCIPLFFTYRVDKVGVILEQRGVFRINCMDCLDRTNVVQSAIARTVLSMQVKSWVQINGVDGMWIKVL